MKDNCRRKELRLFFRVRYGAGAWPEDDAARDDLAIYALHHVGLNDGPRIVRNNIELFAPWLSEPEAADITAQAMDRLIRVGLPNQHELGVQIGLTDAMRERLGLRTIEAHDISSAQREEINRLKMNARKTRDRAKARSKTVHDRLSKRAQAVSKLLDAGGAFVPELTAQASDSQPFKGLARPALKRAVARACAELAEAGVATPSVHRTRNGLQTLFYEKRASSLEGGRNSVTVTKNTPRVPVGYRGVQNRDKAPSAFEDFNGLDGVSQSSPPGQNSVLLREKFASPTILSEEDGDDDGSADRTRAPEGAQRDAMGTLDED